MPTSLKVPCLLLGNMILIINMSNFSKWKLHLHYDIQCNTLGILEMIGLCFSMQGDDFIEHINVKWWILEHISGLKGHEGPKLVLVAIIIHFKVKLYLHYDIKRTTLGYILEMKDLRFSIQGDDFIEHINAKWHILEHIGGLKGHEGPKLVFAGIINLWEMLEHLIHNPLIVQRQF